VAEHQDLQRQLREDRSLVAPFVEEALRLESPIKGDFRLSRVPTTVGGVEIPAEANVTLQRFLDRTAEISIAEARHGPPSARRFEYSPTFMLRGLQQLHLELTPVS
jgi:hypothetical protein